MTRPSFDCDGNRQMADAPSAVTRALISGLKRREIGSTRFMTPKNVCAASGSSAVRAARPVSYPVLSGICAVSRNRQSLPVGSSHGFWNSVPTSAKHRVLARACPAARREPATERMARLPVRPRSSTM